MFPKEFCKVRLRDFQFVCDVGNRKLHGCKRIVDHFFCFGGVIGTYGIEGDWNKIILDQFAQREKKNHCQAGVRDKGKTYIFIFQLRKGSFEEVLHMIG